MEITSNISILIVLSGNRRLVHLEDEIFADKELTSFYLQHLLPNEMTPWYLHRGWRGTFNSEEHKVFKEHLLIADLYSIEGVCPWAAYLYASAVIGGRWLAAERMIAEDYESVICYARDVLNIDAYNKILDNHLYTHALEILQCQK